MSRILLYHQTAALTAPRLAAYMGIESLQRLDNRNAEAQRPDWVIRYGSSRAIPLRPTQRALNRRWALTRHSLRHEQLSRLSEAGVMTPWYSTNQDEAAEWLLQGHPLLGRDYPRDGRQPRRGRGIIEYRNHAVRLREHDLYMLEILKEAQYRVHVAFGSTRTRQLIPDEPHNAEQLIWNHGAGFTFRIPDEIPASVPAVATQAVTALGLDFGAVDIIWTGNHPVVLEVNTAPGLGDPTLEWYAQHLGWAIGLTEDDMPKWEVAERQNPEEV